MKTIYTILVALLLSNSMIAQESSKIVTTGAGYANDIYYSLSNGEVKSSVRASWDIAFITDQMEISILTNGGNGIELYTYPNADYATAWGTTLDITDIATWKPMYNSLDDWNSGAFVRNIDKNNPLDFGWGIYNTSTHHIVGDSIFVIKLNDGSYKKLAIVDKAAMTNTWQFKYANLDGTNEVVKDFDADDYSSMNYIHYSIANGEFVSQEPDNSTWDLLFTKYYDYTIPYSVTGVLTNKGLTVQEVSGVDQASFVDYNAEQFSDIISTIGSDWKTYNSGYTVLSDVVFFIKETAATKGAGDVWKLYFTGFAGSSTGEYQFELINLSTTGIESSEVFSTVYPNPAKHEINVIYDLKGSCDISIFNMNGQLVYNQKANQNSELNKQQINIENLPSGVYNLTIKNESKISFTKFIKQ